MRSTSIALALLLLLSANAAAFTGVEHRCISESALAVAFKDEPAGAACELLPARPDPCGREFKGRQTFGDLTRYVDWYQNPERFADDQSWDIRKRSSRGLHRVWAIHHNFRHFQDEAAKAYSDAHHAALHHSDNLCMALWYEAMALHYLQDFFSPGHVITPRTGSNDPVSGSLHDRYSRRGAPVVITPNKNVPGLGDARTIDLKGDGRLVYKNDDGTLNHASRDFLIALSAASIREIVDKHNNRPRATQLTLCFRKRSANPTSPAASTESAGTAHGPFASVQAHDVPNPQCKCECDPIAQYDFSDDDDLKQGFYKLWGFQAAQLFGVRGGARRVTDIGLLFMADDPKGRLRIRDANNDDDECNDKTFDSGLTAGTSIHYTNVEGARYRAEGLHIEFVEPFKRAQFAVYGGYRRYRHGSRSDKRFEAGVKAGIGLEVVNLVLAVERTHTVDVDGNLQQVYAVMPGLEMIVSPTWLETAAKWFVNLFPH